MDYGVCKSRCKFACVLPYLTLHGSSLRYGGMNDQSYTPNDESSICRRNERPQSDSAAVVYSRHWTGIFAAAKAIMHE